MISVWNVLKFIEHSSLKQRGIIMQRGNTVDHCIWAWHVSHQSRSGMKSVEFEDELKMDFNYFLILQWRSVQHTHGNCIICSLDWEERLGYCHFLTFFFSLRTIRTHQTKPKGYESNASSAQICKNKPFIIVL